MRSVRALLPDHLDRHGPPIGGFGAIDAAEAARLAERLIRPVPPRRTGLSGEGHSLGHRLPPLGAHWARNLSEHGTACPFVAYHVGSGAVPGNAISRDQRQFSGCGFEAPPVGFEPTHPAPEAGALSPELWGPGDVERLPASQLSRGEANGSGDAIAQMASPEPGRQAAHPAAGAPGFGGRRGQSTVAA